VTIGVADGSAVRFETPVVEEAGFTAAWVDDARRQLEVRCEGRATRRPPLLDPRAVTTRA
jgi:hypothetical protein